MDAVWPWNKLFYYNDPFHRLCGSGGKQHWTTLLSGLREIERVVVLTKINDNYIGEKSTPW